MKAIDSQAPWEQVYNEKEIPALGWYEEPPRLSLELIEESGVGRDEMIVDVGAGASSLLRHLLQRGYRALAALDISARALELNRAALPPEGAAQVTWIVGDATDPAALDEVRPVALWHDRATLHFLTDARARAAYHDLLMRSVAPGGHAMLATFAPHGATHCNGLEVHRYDHDSLAEFLGPAWEVVREEAYLFRNPRGEPRPYVYALYQRKAQ